MITSHVVVGGTALAAGFIVVGSLISPPPPIDLLSVEYLNGQAQVRYERRVTAPDVIRAPWSADVVVVGTERSVPECLSAGVADYGPDEPRVQVFDFDVFTAPGCYETLRDRGESYQIVASVTPLGDRPDQVRSPVFTVD